MGFIRKALKMLGEWFKDVDTGRIVVGAAEAVAAVGGTIYMIKDAKKEQEREAKQNQLIIDTVRDTTTELVNSYLADDDESKDEEED